MIANGQTLQARLVSAYRDYKAGRLDQKEYRDLQRWLTGLLQRDTIQSKSLHIIPTGDGR